MTTPQHPGRVEIVEIDDPDEAFEVFDTVCRRELDMPGAEFLRRWDAGEYRETDVDDVEGLPEVVAVLPFAGIEWQETPQ